MAVVVRSPRHRFFSAPRHRLAAGVFFLSAALVVITAAGRPDTSLRPATIQECRCPLASPSWVLYPDSARGMPPVLRARDVQVETVLVCPHGLHFTFASGWGMGRKTYCITFAKNPAPTLAKSNALLNTSSNDNLALEARVGDLDRVLGRNLESESFVVFGGSPHRDNPRIILAPPMALEWHGEQSILAGNIDLYMKK